MTRPFSTLTTALQGSASALLLGLCCSSALASNGFTTNCDDVTDELPAPGIPAPSLNVEIADHGLIERGLIDSAADPAEEEMIAPALAGASTTTSTESDDRDAVVETAPVSNPPATSLRLPGVSEEDQPRFRRQMYRTDI